jgi:2'-5' RNA ligase
MGARGEVVDDVGLRVADRRAHHLRVEQVDAQPARARQVEDHVTRGGAQLEEMAPGEPGGARDEDPPAQSTGATAVTATPSGSGVPRPTPLGFSITACARMPSAVPVIVDVTSIAAEAFVLGQANDATRILADARAAMGGEKLAAIRFTAFFLPIAGVGCFPAKGRPGVLWAGVGRGHPQLFHLHKKIQEAALVAGLEPDLRAWHPHITLARCRDVSAESVRPFLKTNAAFDAGLPRVDSFALYSSIPGPLGSAYTCELEVPANS